MLGQVACLSLSSATRLLDTRAGGGGLEGKEEGGTEEGDGGESIRETKNRQSHLSLH